MKKALIVLLTLCVGYGLECAVDHFFEKKKQEIKTDSKMTPADYERRYLPYVDDKGRYHEPIGGGIYAVWPSKEVYLKAHEGENNE